MGVRARRQWGLGLEDDGVRFRRLWGLGLEGDGG